MTSLDFDLRGIVAIRLIDPTERDAATIRRQLGPIDLPPGAPLGREPDIVIRFVDRMPSAGRLRYLGLEDAAFDDSAFYLLRGRYNTPVRVRVPFEAIGRQCEIVCERGLPAVPHLVAIVNLTALGNGRVPLHAAGFVHRGLGVLVTGWAKGGKTETLLGFMARGAEYVGDEWVYLDPTSGTMCGLPEPMRVWDWQIRSVPGLAGAVPARSRATLTAVRGTTTAVRAVGRLPVLQGRAPGRTIARGLPYLERQLAIQVPPAELFGGRARHDSVPVDRVLFVVSSDRPDIVIAGEDPLLVAERSVHSLDHERLDLLATYDKFRYAFPEQRNALLEAAGDQERRLLRKVLEGRTALRVEHPYPPDILAMVEAIDRRLD
jgi:hypothetical protein